MNDLEQDGTSRPLDISGTFDDLRTALFRYYDTPFGLADQELERERKALFDVAGGAWQRPLLEVRPVYTPAGRTIADSVKEAGARSELASLLQHGLISGIPQLYGHQHEALVSAHRYGRNVIVTAGTGSGKTESFMLPILADLVEESYSWGTPAPGGTNRWWAGAKTPYQKQRPSVEGRHQAIRAMVLYPMNALVDDQMMRLRKALDSDEVRQWFDRHRPGHHFYFGRYTGASPVPGEPGSRAATGILRRELAATERRAAQAQHVGGDARFFVPRLDGAEMRSRWDMLDAPPDLLVTNYSMLNVMMMREREAAVFDRTRVWLRDVPDARFTLVVDELHMYRGTAGTEVAYLLRNLRHRLGLDRQPERFRILAASASLETPRDLGFLEEFFGRPRDTFELLGGALQLPPMGSTDISAYGSSFAALGPRPEPAQADEVLRTKEAGSALVNALRDGDRLITRHDTAVAADLFPKLPEAEQLPALRGLLGALAATTIPDAARLRGHLFFRNIPGVWACSDPACTGLTASGADRTVGRLFSRPALRCEDCNARVLELLYCQTCGDIFLGGYAPAQAVKSAHGKPFNAGLLADLPDLEQLPDAASAGPTAGNYVVYWPRTRQPVVDQTHWQRTAGKGTQSADFKFKPSSYDPRTGRLRNTVRGSTGWSFHTQVPLSRSGRPRITPDDLPAAPTCCPACGDDWEIPRLGREGALELTDRRRLRSPIRSMRTGFEKVNQVLATALLSRLEEKKIVVFSDSRQDAAKLAAGLGLRHYQDLLRLFLAEEVAGQGDPEADLEAVSAYYRGDATGPDHQANAEAAYARLKRRDPNRFLEWERLQRGAAGPSALGGLSSDGGEDQRADELRALLARVPSLTEHISEITERLLVMGANPGGPAASLQQTPATAQSQAERWTSLYDWPEGPGTTPVPRSGRLLSDGQESLRADISDSLREHVLHGLFGRAGLDFESLGLGWLCLAVDNEPIEADRNSTTALVRASLRVLGHLRRFDGLSRTGQDAPPKRLRNFWEAAAQQLATTPEDVQARVEQAWGDAVRQYLIRPSEVALRHGRGETWTCPRCKRRHLHPGAGTCTDCGSPLPGVPKAFDGAADDYYAWMAQEQLGRFRLHCAELTGQTDRIDAQARQARFQDVFLDEESPLSDGVELLSVTTTMEAGVDIGPLSAVLMANMPPTRFNYQQRVGRAGRRTAPVALALTLCRGRSHDEYYFQHPEKITNEETPRPYLSTDMPDICQRLVAAEVLRQAFLGTQDDREGGDPTRNVHGQFGLTADWAANGPHVRAWLHGHTAEITAVASALTAFTRSPQTPEQWCLWAQGELADLIDTISAQPVGHQDLSQRLAEAGVLPMFGFPTSVRYLYTRRPREPYPWPPAGTVDRALPIAVSQFAPGAETVKDGRVHTAVGVVGFEPAGPNAVRAAADPLGPVRVLGICRSCGHIEEEVPPQLAIQEPDGSESEAPALPCPACAAADGSYQAVTLREPVGFFSPNGRDFDGNFAWRARSLAPRTAANLKTDAPRRRLAAPLAVHAGKGRRYAVNDNGGRLFQFHQVKPTAVWSGGYVEQSAIERSPFLERDLTEQQPVAAAIGAVQMTDLFLLGPENAEMSEQGLRLNLAAPRQISGFPQDRSARKAAWYSLAALLRSAASKQLEIHPSEMAAGIYGAVDGGSAARVFAVLRGANRTRR